MTKLNKTTKRLRAESSVLVVIDAQDKLLAKIPAASELIQSVGFLLDVAALLGVAVKATEQYPKGLGPTTGKIACRLPQPISAKTAFSCCGAGTLLEELEVLQRPNIVLTGAETHVCVMQTALDLIDAGLHVFLPVDAVAARFAIDHTTAIRRIELAGGIATTAETIAFEWLADAAHPQFKAVSKLVIERAASRT
jgi:nicotinamidase-related amidase